MISPKEIMKGCIVNYQGKARIVKGVMDYVILEGTKEWIGASLMNGEPITEVWLERFGFAKNEEGSFFKQLNLLNWGVSMIPPNIRTAQWTAAQGFVNVWQELRLLEYCHQLQVMYFGLFQDHLPVPKLPKL